MQRSHSLKIAGALVLAAVLASVEAHGQQAGGGSSSMPPGVAHASSDECAVIVATGKTVAGWDRHGPTWPLRLSYNNYREDCDWHRFGVGAPIEAIPRMTSAMIARPEFSPSHRSARVYVDFRTYAG